MNKSCICLKDNYMNTGLDLVSTWLELSIEKYSGDLKSNLVWISNGPKQVGFQMVWISNGI